MNKMREGHETIKIIAIVVTLRHATKIVAIVTSHTTTRDAYNDIISLYSDNVGVYVDYVVKVDVDDD